MGLSRGLSASGGEVIAVGHADPAGISLLDRAEGRLLAFVPLPHEPLQILVDLERRKIVASGFENRLSLLSPDAPERLFSRRLSFQPLHMEQAPTGTIALNGLPGEGMWLLDAAGRGSGRRIRGLLEPHNFRFDRYGRRLFVADRGRSGIAVVDVAAAERREELAAGVMRSLPAAAVPDQLALAGDGRGVLLVADGADRLVWIDLEARTFRLGPAL